MPTNGRRSEVSSSEDVTVAQESELAPEAEADVLPERVGPYRIVEQIADLLSSTEEDEDDPEAVQYVVQLNGFPYPGLVGGAEA